MRTYTLELKVHFDEESRYEIVKNHLKEQARETLSVCLLLAGDRTPQIALHSQDFFHGNEDLEITEEVTND